MSETLGRKDWIAWLEKKGVQKPAELPKGEDYGIDGLYAAVDILQKTLGKVNGYQTDDGILEHECAISAVKKLYEQKPAWSEEDEQTFIKSVEVLEDFGKFELADWLKEHKNKSLRPQKHWKPSEEQLTQLSNASNGLYYNCETLLSLLEQLKKLREE